MYLRENALLSANFEILPSKLTIPDSISSIIIARIDKLTQLLKQVVQTASILGREFAADVLSKMLTDIPVKNYLKEGEKESIWNAVTELKYLFKHSLLRETVYEMQLKKRIRELHQLAAETYLNLYAKNVQEHYPEICFHFEKAGNREKTKQYLKEAADYSINHSHIFDAVHFMERLYSILFNEFNIDDFLISNEMEIEQDFSPYVQLALRLAEYYWYCGFAQKSADLFEQTLEFIKKWGDKKALLKGLIAQNKLFVDIGEYHKGLENIKLADEIFESFQDKGLWIEINNSAGQIYNEFGDYSKAIQHYEAALNASAEQRDEDLLSVIYTNLGVSYSYLGKYDKAIDLLEKALAIEEKVNRTISKVKVLRKK
jgi:tetratricopeptide (TPR) repeat protein